MFAQVPSRLSSFCLRYLQWLNAGTVVRLLKSVCGVVPTTHGATGIFVSQGRIHCDLPFYEQLKGAPQLLQEDPLGLSGPYYNGCKCKRKHRYFSFLLVKYQLLQEDPLGFCFTISSDLSGPYYNG